MGIMVYPLLWVMQDLYHQPYHPLQPRLGKAALERHWAKGMNSGNPGPLTADRGGPFLPKEGSTSTISILILVLILD